MNQPTTNPPPIGIDLGTTYSVIAHLDASGRPVTIINNQGDLLTPSAVFFDRDDVMVGREAVRAAVMEPDAYAECFKRDMGGSVYHRKVRGVDVPPEVLERLRPGTAQAGRRIAAGADPPGRDHGAGIFRRNAAQGHAGRGPLGRARSPGHHQRAHGRGGRLWLPAGVLRSCPAVTEIQRLKPHVTSV